jgi:hypothetical protein
MGEEEAEVRMHRLRYMHGMLREMLEGSKADRLWTLSYFLEMAYLEAGDRIRASHDPDKVGFKRRPKRK